MTAELPANLAVLIKLQRECFQRQHEALAEAEADFEHKVSEFEAVAGKAVDSHVTQNPPVQQGVTDLFAKLPWKTNSKGEWMFADKEEAKPIIAKIGTMKGTRWTDGGYEYYVSVSEDGTRFLNRSKVARK